MARQLASFKAMSVSSMEAGGMTLAYSPSLVRVLKLKSQEVGKTVGMMR
jgi:hypothetical protein